MSLTAKLLVYYKILHLAAKKQRLCFIVVYNVNTDGGFLLASLQVSPFGLI